MAPETIPDFLNHQIRTKTKVLIVLLFDGLILAAWLLFSCGVQKVAEYVRDQGVNEHAAMAFHYTSSGSVFLLALLYILDDLWGQAKQVIGNHRGVTGVTEGKP